ncbi:MAG: hypothetical protein ACJAXR_000478 [Halopseudomonas sp.]|jgi:hypothetical protein
MMKDVRRYLSHINLADATWSSDSEVPGVPPQLRTMFLRAIEKLCASNRIGMNGRGNETLEIEIALDEALRLVCRYLELAQKDDEYAEENYLQGLNSTHKCNAHPCINFVWRLPSQALTRT